MFGVFLLMCSWRVFGGVDFLCSYGGRLFALGCFELTWDDCDWYLGVLIWFGVVFT